MLAVTRGRRFHRCRWWAFLKHVGSADSKTSSILQLVMALQVADSGSVGVGTKYKTMKWERCGAVFYCRFGFQEDFYQHSTILLVTSCCVCRILFCIILLVFGPPDSSFFSVRTYQLSAMPGGMLPSRSVYGSLQPRSFRSSAHAYSSTRP